MSCETKTGPLQKLVVRHFDSLRDVSPVRSVCASVPKLQAARSYVGITTVGADLGGLVMDQEHESFHSLLDEPLIVAIANDHDLHNPSGYEAAHAILQGLAQNVPSEEATGFNPSGTYGPFDDGDDQIKDGVTASATSLSELASQAHKTDTSNTSRASSNAESGYAVPRLAAFHDGSEESRVLQLQGLFPDLKEYDIKFSLQKAKGDFQIVLDNLLNIQYLQSTGQQVKGIDGFFHQDDPTVGKKKKKKGKKSTDHGSCMPHNRSTSSSHTKEFKDQSEIAYIAERFNISFDEVSVIYYEKDCSDSSTVVEILDQHISHKNVQPLNETGRKTADGLARKYRNVPEEYLKVIIEVTGSMCQFSDDLAALANKHFSKRPRSERFGLSYRLTPLPDEEIEGRQRTTRKMSVSDIKDGNRWTTPQVSPNNISDLSLAVQMSESFSQARRDVAESAARLHRKGASNPLYRQAAGYYAERAREQASYAHEAMSTAADLLVEQQSTGEVVDLHGVSVHDGVRIARQKAMGWWQNHGEFRGKKTQDHGLTIITGLGRHCAGGVSQLRKAVVAVLLQDGWKLRIETGRFVITGR